MMKAASFAPVAFLATTVVLGSAAPSYAQVVPFRASGDNAVYSTPLGGGNGDTSGYGEATHMGAVFGSGNALPIPPTNQWVASNYQLTAANGDKIFFEGGGTVELIPLYTDEEGDDWFSARWTGQFWVTGGTGRFASVAVGDEPIVVLAENNPFRLTDPVWTYSWELSGTIDLGKRKN